MRQTEVIATKGKGRPVTPDGPNPVSESEGSGRRGLFRFRFAFLGNGLRDQANGAFGGIGAGEGHLERDIDRHDQPPPVELTKIFHARLEFQGSLRKMFQDEASRPAVHGRSLADNLGTSHRTQVIGQTLAQG